MTLSLGDVPASSTLYIPFASYNSAGASVTLTGLAATDIEVYKNGSVTQRASDNGYALLDTDGIDFDGLTGIHGFSIDLADNSDSGFYAVGSQYWVVVSSVTIDGQAVNFIAVTFRIVAAEAVAGVPEVDVTHVAGTAAQAASGRFQVDVELIEGTDATDVLATLDDAVLAAVAGVQSDTNDIQARLPAALSANGNIKADVKEVNDVVVDGAGTGGDPWGPV